MRLLCSVLLAMLWLRTAVGQEVQPVSSSEDISEINNLRTDEAPQVSIDPRLRRALLRVLTKLEEEDRRKGQHDAARQMAEVMQNIITEEDFIKYFQEQGLEKDLLDNFESKEPTKPQGRPNYEEILSYSAEDEKKDTVTPFTFASYPKDKEIDSEEEFKTTPDTLTDYQNKDKYPSTNPTPSLANAIYFQIPEPVQIQESSDEEEPKVSSQETRSIQGPTLVSPHENEFQAEQEEQKVSFVSVDQPEKENIGEEPSIRFITVDEVRPKETQEEESNQQEVKNQQEQSEDTIIEDEEPRTKVEFQASNGTEIEDTEDSENAAMKVKMEKHEVEFLHAPLLAAFTVQQDQQGLPRRVIPLNYQLSGEPIPLPNNKPDQQQQQQQQVSSSQVALEEKQKLLQQQIQFLQGQQLQEQQYQRLQEFVKQRQRLLEEETQRQLLLDNQKRQYENEQRLALARQKQQQILFQNQQQDSQLEALKELERQRYFRQQNVQQQSFQPVNQPQNINFQKSVDYQFQTNSQQLQQNFQQPLNTFQPSFNNFNSGFQQQSVELNRVNRHEPSNFIGNFGLSTPRPSLNFHSQGRSTAQPFVQPTQPTYIQPSNYIQSNNFQHRFAPVNNFYSTRQPSVTLDGQLQSLLSISGISGGFNGKPSAQEDLNIVSKVLALGHGEPLYQRQQFQASSKHEVVVEPPARVIEPPKP